MSGQCVAKRAETGIAMNREEFLRLLETALAGRVSDQIVRENISYYRNYINEQVGTGKSEAEVLSGLGDPRLIAKTIEGSSRFAADGQQTAQTGYGGAFGESYQESVQDAYGGKKGAAFHQEGLPGWLVAGIVLVVLVLVLMAVFRVLVFFAPFILIIVAVSIVLKIVRGWFGGS